jgi:hypothetical protein
VIQFLLVLTGATSVRRSTLRRGGVLARVEADSATRAMAPLESPLATLAVCAPVIGLGLSLVGLAVLWCLVGAELHPSRATRQIGRLGLDDAPLPVLVDQEQGRNSPCPGQRSPPSGSGSGSCLTCPFIGLAQQATSGSLTTRSCGADGKPLCDAGVRRHPVGAGGRYTRKI